jgi:polysaccharide export outer membrane protein
MNDGNVAYLSPLFPDSVDRVFDVVRKYPIERKTPVGKGCEGRDRFRVVKVEMDVDTMSAYRRNLRSLARLAVCAACIAVTAGCATYPGWLGSSGPSRQQVQDKQDARGINGIQLIDVTDEVTRKLMASQKQQLFSEVFTLQAPRSGYVVGAGDMITVSIWEAPPAMLFSGMMMQSSSTGTVRTMPTGQMTSFPEQMVSSDGTINVPFAGRIVVTGHEPPWIEEEVVRRLRGRANQPQVMVQVTRNVTSNVTVVGEVTTSLRMPLTAKGESLLDALAAAGGVKQPVNKMTLQITRGDKVQSLPLETIIRDPRQNIALQPGDLITALFQPMSFMVLGATGKNDEVNFEAQGISLAQALARAGGLDDVRADARAVFIFRFEDKNALDWGKPPQTTPDGKVPVIYQLDLKDPATFFLAQNFPVHNRDVLYVSNAPASELQKFMSIVVTTLYPAVAAKTLNIVK